MFPQPVRTANRPNKGDEMKSIALVVGLGLAAMTLVDSYVNQPPSRDGFGTAVVERCEAHYAVEACTTHAVYAWQHQSR